MWNAGQVAICQNALADGGDFSLDFTAAAPLTYNHSTGDGAYNDRTVGRDQDIVESLEGGDFSCGDTVTFLTQISVNAAAAGAQTIRLRFEFTAHSTGPTGNMQARLASASVLAPVADDISSGDQTIPFKQVGDIKPCDPKICSPPCDPKDCPK